MVILLDGTSKLGRVTIAETAIESFPAWKHLAIEVIAGATPEEAEEDLHIQVVARCAQELSQDGLHLLLTLPSDSPDHPKLVSALEPECITVHLGNASDGNFDHALDPHTQSMKDVVNALHAIMRDV